MAKKTKKTAPVAAAIAATPAPAVVPCTPRAPVKELTEAEILVPPQYPLVTPRPADETKDKRFKFVNQVVQQMLLSATPTEVPGEEYQKLSQDCFFVAEASAALPGTENQAYSVVNLSWFSFVPEQMEELKGATPAQVEEMYVMLAEVFDELSHQLMLHAAGGLMYRTITWHEPPSRRPFCVQAAYGIPLTETQRVAAAASIYRLTHIVVKFFTQFPRLLLGEEHVADYEGHLTALATEEPAEVAA